MNKRRRKKHALKVTKELMELFEEIRIHGMTQERLDRGREAMGLPYLELEGANE